MEEFLMRTRHKLLIGELTRVIALAGLMDFVQNVSSTIEAEAL